MTSNPKPIPIAMAYIRAMGRGGSEPQLLRFEDGYNRVVKFPNNNQGVVTLANEIIVSRIGGFLGVSCPLGNIVKVPQELIDAEPSLRRDNGEKFAGGYSFASEYHEAIDDPGKASLSLASNLSDLAGIVVLDSLCANSDRGGNTGNLLLTTIEGESRVMAIDHGHCFGHQWDENIVSKAGDVQVICSDDFVAHIQPHDFDAFLSKLRQLEANVLEELTAGPKDLWDLTSSRLEAIKTYIGTRTSRAEQLIRERWPETRR